MCIHLHITGRKMMVGRDGKQSGGEKKGRKKEESKGKREDRLD